MPDNQRFAVLAEVECLFGSKKSHQKDRLTQKTVKNGVKN